MFGPGGCFNPLAALAPPPGHQPHPVGQWPTHPGGFPMQALGTSGAHVQPRRKNATRETTMVLKQWLNSHKRNPYPTKNEKIFLAVITCMSLTQVSTWFANARRRLKKENKMTWSPRNRCDDDDDDDEDVDNDVEEDHHSLYPVMAAHHATVQAAAEVAARAQHHAHQLQQHVMSPMCNQINGPLPQQEQPNPTNTNRQTSRPLWRPFA